MQMEDIGPSSASWFGGSNVHVGWYRGGEFMGNHVCLIGHMGEKSCFHTLNKTIIPTNATYLEYRRRLAEAKDNVSDPCKQASTTKSSNSVPSTQALYTTHVMSFSFCRLSFLSKHFRKLDLNSLYTLCRHYMKQDN